MRERRVPQWDGVRAVLADGRWTDRAAGPGPEPGPDPGPEPGPGPAPEELRGAVEQLLASLDEVSDALRP
ncbi:hypothetical protein AB0N09_17790 [Streptomyces erythrochromogenes]|uniref:hypothetical protein n=1 Tax=Streptomyces erythrochromogenes TaxID=285574 RepID=UPI00343C0E83